MKIAIARLSRDNLPDYFQVHSAANGTDWCFCSAWWVPTWEGWSKRTAEANLDIRQEHFTQGNFDGYLFYVEDQPVGWCQVGPRDRLEKLRTAYDLSPDPEVWAFSCFLLTPAYRGRGLAHTFLESVLADLSRQGIRRVQAFPRGGDGLEKHEIWTGPESIYRRVDFLLKKDGQRGPVLEKRL